MEIINKMGMTIFKKIAVKTFLEQDDVRLKNLYRFLEKQGCHLVDESGVPNLIISVGGDATLLHHAKFAHENQIPILGINTGQVGFLADVEAENEAVLESILEGHYILDERLMLECEFQGKRYLAVNEVMFMKAESTKLVRYEVFVDDRFMYQQMGDGLIITTPTGSTAYALSAGGPILHPNIDAMSLVPVCSRHLSSRVVTIPANSEVRVNVLPWKGTRAVFSIDASVNHEAERIDAKYQETFSTITIDSP